ncbi:MAG: rpoE 2 [Gemmataceae bacterium]|nr:rpoE 2 [Gemmataceae bacterium]
MPGATLEKVLCYLRHAAEVQVARDLTDAELLERFRTQRDEAAFTLLVQRHGPMVLGVCRRLLGDLRGAEDAFQATFLVLSRKATSIHKDGSLAAWLHGVALRIAHKARGSAIRRREHERRSAVEARYEPVDERTWDELRLILDEELVQLPEKYRAPVVLCYFEGKTNEQAAQELGCPKSSLSWRLGRARELLRERLVRRGITLSTGALAAVLLEQTAAAGVPALLVLSAVRAATTFAAGGAAFAAASAEVAALTKGVLRTMFLTKLKAAALGGLLLAVGVWVSGALAGPPAVPPPPAANADDKKPQPAAMPPGPGTLIVGRAGACWVLTPDGKRLPELPIPDKTHSRGHAALSPDGLWAAYVATEGEPLPREPEDKPWPFKVVVRKLDKPDEGKEWDVPAQDLDLRWTADGKKLVAAKMTSFPNPVAFESVLLDPETGKTEKLDLSDNIRVLDCGRDGKTFLVETIEAKTKKSILGLATTGEKEVRTLTKMLGPSYLNGYSGCTNQGRFSPDGTKVLFTDGDPEQKHAYQRGMSSKPYLLDVKTGTREAVGEFPENAQATGIAWSPDGKRIAYAWKQLHEKLLKKGTLDPDEAIIETEAFLVVADADGKNAKTVSSDKGPHAFSTVFGTIDWR